MALLQIEPFETKFPESGIKCGFVFTLVLRHILPEGRKPHFPLLKSS